MLKSAVISVGKEIVSGITQDTNSYFISSCLSRIGIYNRFVLSCDDKAQDIIDTVKFCLNKVDIVITTGGLGPTFDDITIESVATALGKGLYLDSEALKFIHDFYTKLYQEGKIETGGINEKRMKMAYLIEGCKPLKNSIGAAWGVYVKQDKKHLFCLPGIPKEMKPMFEKEVLPVLRKLSNSTMIVKNYDVPINDESVLGEAIDKVMKKYPVYIKSLPIGFESSIMSVRFTAYAQTEDEAKKRIEEAKKELVNLLNNL
ncbi:competence/damage-inducible protein A [Hippea maritima]|uniref:Molybdopterin binding domain protein n=1 Tax=Hippea maritima (strain ATCC 700847 / DSM 10411 / MH2) TaxID=760142 RepID=F2LW81_HIPMA|nr:molybdopterin-binding protein [Hippea maritima]AEA34015.1 molybdopterin binding domain protein [Hippea maritima DSM 10411]